MSYSLNAGSLNPNLPNAEPLNASPLKTGGLITAALLACTALETIAPQQARAESDPGVPSASQPLPVIPSSIPQAVVPAPATLPLPQVPGRDYIPFTPVGEVVPDVSPTALPPAGMIAGVEIEVIPFESETINSAAAENHAAGNHAAGASGPLSSPAVPPPRASLELPTVSDLVLSDISRPTAQPIVERARVFEGERPSPQENPATTEAIAIAPDEPAASEPQASTGVPSQETSRQTSQGTSQTPEPPNLTELLTFTEQVTQINAEPIAQINSEPITQTSAAQVTAANTTPASQTNHNQAAPGPVAAEKSELLADAEAITEATAPPEHRGWFDRQLAETAARQKAQREARLRENLIDTARRHLAQNNVTAAQQIAQNPVFLDAERTALQQAIASAQPAAEAPTPEPKTQLARDVARLAARQTWLLERLPAVAESSCKGPQGVAAAGDRPAPACTIDPARSATASNYAWLVQAANRPQQLSGRLPLRAAAPITSRYGWRIHPIFGDHRFHAGVDFGAPLGTPVHASLSGYVETSEYLSGYGFTVVLEDSSGQERHLYAHLADLGVRPGQWVSQGQVVGWVGNTGNSTGPHLHFEVHRLAQSGWITVDPLSVASQQNANL